MMYVSIATLDAMIDTLSGYYYYGKCNMGQNMYPSSL